MKHLYLLPNSLNSKHSDASQWFSPMVKDILSTVDGIFIESEKGAGVLLKILNISYHIRSKPTILVNEHTKPKEILELIKEIPKTELWALISDAGLPGIADPGAVVVRFAHQLNIPITPIPGPSSIFLALMASGLNGQRFCFQGYLPREKHDRKQLLTILEKESQAKGMTQIFIETPYRNSQLFDDLISTLQPETQLSIASDLTGPNEYIFTTTINLWKKNRLTLSDENPTVFLFLA